MNIKHEGVSAHRTKDDCHHGRLEAAFAEAWLKANEPPRFLNRGVGTLQLLLASDDRGDITRPITQEEATAAATVVQWLGSPVGFSWLMETLAGTEYRITRKVSP